MERSENQEAKRKEFEDKQRLITEAEASELDRRDVVELTFTIGKEITVNRSLLTSVRGSALEAVFGCRDAIREAKNQVFVDSESNVFQHVIEYLKNGGRTIPQKVIQDKQLLSEFNKELSNWDLTRHTFSSEKKSSPHTLSNGDRTMTNSTGSGYRFVAVSTVMNAS